LPLNETAAYSLSTAICTKLLVGCAIGRLVEFANSWFVVRQFAESGFGRLAALEKREWQKWVDCDNSLFPKENWLLA